MAKVITAKLTQSYIAEKIKANGERQTFRDATCQGLILRVGAKGRMTWAYDYRNPDGKRQTYTIGTTDTCDPGKARLMVEKKRGTDPAGQKREVKVEANKAESRTLHKFLEGRYWTDHLQHAKGGGKDTKKRILAAWSGDDADDCLLDQDMENLNVQEFIQHRLDRLADDLKPQTLNRDRAALLSMLNTAVGWKLISKNALEDPGFAPLKTEDDRRVRWLGQKDDIEDVCDDQGAKLGERQRFMDALRHKDTPIYLRQMSVVALNTGMRRGEIFKLCWDNVSIQLAIVTVSAKTAKSNKTRHIPLNTSVLPILEELAKVRHISGLVFVNPDTEKPFTTVKKSWAALSTNARLDDFNFHDLRHDFASRLVQSRVNLYEVKDLLGHSSITLTERYAHLAPHQKRAAVAMLEAAA